MLTRRRPLRRGYRFPNLSEVVLETATALERKGLRGGLEPRRPRVFLPLDVGAQRSDQRRQLCSRIIQPGLHARLLPHLSERVTRRLPSQSDALSLLGLAASAPHRAPPYSPYPRPSRLDGR